MKKTISLIIMSLMVLSILSVAGIAGNHQSDLDDDKICGIDEGCEILDESEKSEREEGRERVKIEILSGLEVALTRVENERARTVIKNNIEKFEERHSDRLHTYSEIEIEEEIGDDGEIKTIIKLKQKGKWFGAFPGTLPRTFELDEQGNMNERAKFFLAFLFTEDK